jgi:anti-sigma B factor antagonist
MNDGQISIETQLVSEQLGVIAASGYINNEGGQAIADAATDLIGQGASSLLIDLDGTRIINSIGVSILLEIMERLMEENGRLAFCNLTPTISKTFEIMGLVQYAAIYPDRANALSEIQPDGTA